ncbi:hypothetical protein [Mediterraneibacter gnavus]|uniref:hypothetical protein n=1 Tax=Mediterraneibacter gnavus TaxID=33038 RepID=UPI0032B82C39
MELGRKNPEAPEKLETEKSFENEATRNPEQDKKRADSLDENKGIEKISEQKDSEKNKKQDFNQTPEEKRAEKIEQKSDLHIESNKGQENSKQEKQKETHESMQQENYTSKMKLEDMNWVDVHQMQEQNQEKLDSINKEYQERISAEGFGMSVEEYRAHLDRIEKANAPEESQEEIKSEDWRSQMEDDLLKKADVDFKEEQSEVKRDSVQEWHEKSEEDSLKNNNNDEVQDKISYPADTVNEMSDQRAQGAQSSLQENSVDSEVQILSNEDMGYQEGNYEKSEPNNDIYNFESESVYERYQKEEQDNVKQESSSNVSEENKIKEVSRYSPEIQERIEKYSSETFRKEDSFDISVYNKNEICENNHILSEKDGETMLSKEQIQEIKKLRESVPHPTEDTVMQKVVSEEQIKRYIEPSQDKIDEYGGLFGGCISKAEDAAPFTKTPKEAYDNLRLDYENNPYQYGEVPVYAVRFNVGKDEINKLSIPYGNEFSEEGKNYPLDKPMTGSGFTGSREALIPEYVTVSNGEDKSKSNITPIDGMIFKISEDESGKPEEKLYAIWDDEDDRFVLLNKVGEWDDR